MILAGALFNEFLRVSETQPRSNFAHRLDDGNLVSSHISKDDVEFRLLFDGFDRTSSRTSRSDRCSGGYAPGFFQFLHEIDSFQNGKLAEFFNEFVNISHFVVFLLVRYRRPRSLRGFQCGSRHTDEEPLCVQATTGDAVAVRSDLLVRRGGGRGRFFVCGSVGIELVLNDAGDARRRFEDGA